MFALLTLLVFAGWMASLTAMMGNLALLSSAMDPVIWILLILGWIAFVGALIVFAWNLWLT